MRILRPGIALGVGLVAALTPVPPTAQAGGSVGFTLTASIEGEGQPFAFGSKHKVLITVADVPGEASLRNITLSVKDVGLGDPGAPAEWNVPSAEDEPVVCDGGVDGAAGTLSLEPGQSLNCTSGITATPGHHTVTVTATASVPGEMHPRVRSRGIAYFGMMPPPARSAHLGIVPPPLGGEGTTPGSGRPPIMATPRLPIMMPLGLAPDADPPTGLDPPTGIMVPPGLPIMMPLGLAPDADPPTGLDPPAGVMVRPGGLVPPGTVVLPGGVVPPGLAFPPDGVVPAGTSVPQGTSGTSVPAGSVVPPPGTSVPPDMSDPPGSAVPVGTVPPGAAVPPGGVVTPRGASADPPVLVATGKAPTSWRHVAGGLAHAGTSAPFLGLLGTAGVGIGVLLLMVIRRRRAVETVESLKQ